MGNKMLISVRASPHMGQQLVVLHRGYNDHFVATYLTFYKG